MADRAVAEERGAAADRLHRHGRLGRRVGDVGDLGRRLARGQRVVHRIEHVEHGLLPDLRLAARRDRVDRLAEGAGKIGAVRLGRKLLAERHEQRAESGPDAPPTVITSLVPIAFSASGSGLAAKRVEIGAHGLEAALHVEPVVAVADRLVERASVPRHAPRSCPPRPRSAWKDRRRHVTHIPGSCSVGSVDESVSGD